MVPKISSVPETCLLQPDKTQIKKMHTHSFMNRFNKSHSFKKIKLSFIVYLKNQYKSMEIFRFHVAKCVKKWYDKRHDDQVEEKTYEQRRYYY